MLSFEEWRAEVSRLQDAIRLNNDRMEYRMLEIGCALPDIARCLSKEKQDRVDEDSVMAELRYLNGRYRAQLDYIKANGVLPPSEESGDA